MPRRQPTTTATTATTATTTQPTAATPSITLALSPEGRLHLHPDETASSLPVDVSTRIQRAFAAGSGPGLLHLGAAELTTALPQPWAWWRDFAGRFLTALRRLPTPDGAASPGGATDAPVDVPMAREDVPVLILTAPPQRGGEYLDAAVLARLWAELGAALHRAAGADPNAWLAAQHPGWHAIGRVHLHLAEHKADPALPFAFLATYTTRLSATARPQHVPMGRAVQEAAASGDRQGLIALLEPVQRAAERSPWLAALVASGALYTPARWSAEEAFAMLREVPALERSGLLVRMPASWRRGRPARAQVMATGGSRGSAALGTELLVDFRVGLCVDGEPLSEGEIAAMLAGVDGLQLLRGQWVEVDRERLAAMLSHYEAVHARATSDGLGFHDAMRLIAGAAPEGDGDEGPETRPWAQVVAGEWLAEILAELRDPQGSLAPAEPGTDLKATLRPYQVRGVGWLHLLVRLGLGACLADDMGLGKTLQVLALLLTLKHQGDGGPALVVVPASLLGNWQAEARRFAPDLRLRVAHSSARGATSGEGRGTNEVALVDFDAATLANVDLVLTTYGMVVRNEALRRATWRLCILDEAQAIKNPGTRQTRAVKSIRATARVVMTGTPVENRLGDLWSLMDFLNPGLLGTAAAFQRQIKNLDNSPEGYAPLRRLVQPYLLRRRKTDPTVITDLPDKTELRAFCGLSRLQAALYQAAVDDLREALASADGIARRGVVLASLMRFKQICNHPSQWLGDGAWRPDDSGKFARLREIAEVVGERQDKMLVFTQFRQTIEPLRAFLRDVLGRDGLVLHGGTAVRARSELVGRFQEDPTVPYLILSLKAGGTGLNLTAASHVVHFDRWWNPAVEDQATDRAFRIGQRRNVLVHKLVCRGTVEERIDALINDKRQLADAVLRSGGEVALTEMSDSDLMATVALDLNAALGGS